MMDDMDHDILASLRDCLLQLSQGRVLERRKQIDVLKSLLKRKEILQVLDRNSLRKKQSETNWRSLITWSKVFTYVKGFIQQETERYEERESEKPLQVLILSWKERRLCTDLFKYIVNMLVTRNQSSACGPVVDHILSVLSRPFTQAAFGLDYTNVLLKEILSSPQMCLKIDSEVFEDLIWCYCKLIKKPPLDWDRALLAPVLYQLMLSGYSQYDLKPLFQFFTSTLGSTKIEKANRYYEYLLKSLMLFCKNVGSSSRVCLCVLGETVILPIIQLWKTNPTDSAKDSMLEFCVMQLALHHPKGAIDEASGAFANDWSCWRNILLQLYQLIMRELSDICIRNKYSSRDSTPCLRPNFIPLAIEVCAQMFRDSYCSFDISQLTCETGGVLKKRRIEVGFVAFINELRSHSSRTEIIPWLQLISAFLRKYKDIVPLEDIMLVINLLIDIHLSCNQVEVKTWLLTACQASVAAFCVSKQNNLVDEIYATNCDWHRLWELGLKCVALMHQCHEAGHKLLQTLLLNKLIVPKSEFFNLYKSGSNNKVSQSSLTTLSIYLYKYPLPSTRGTSDTISESGADKNWFHYQILNWLFQRDNDEDLAARIPHYLSSNDVDANTIQTLAGILTCICLQDLRSAMEKLLMHKITSDSVKPSWIEELEEELLQSTFECPLKIEVETSSNSDDSLLFCGNISNAVYQYTIESFFNTSHQLLENFRESQISSSIKAFVLTKLGLLIVSFLKNLLLCGAISEADVCENLPNNLKNLMATSIKLLHEIHTSVQVPNKNSTIINLLALLSPFTTSVSGKTVLNLNIKRWLVEIFPDETQNVLLNIANGEIKKNGMESPKSKASSSISPTKSGLQSPAKRRPNRYVSVVRNLVKEDDEMESSFGEVESGNSTELIDSFLLVDEDNLRELSKLQIRSANVLVSLCNFVSSDTECFSPHHIVKQLLNIVQSKTASGLNTSDDIHVVLQFLMCVLQMKVLEKENVNAVIVALKMLLNKFSKCRLICKNIVHLFNSLYPHLYSSSALDLTEEKDHTLHLLHVLWSKEKTNRCNKTVSFALAETLSHLIKCDPSVHWSKSGSSDDGDVQNVWHLTEDYFQLLRSNTLCVKLFVGTQVKYMFQSAGGCPTSFAVQNQMFESTCQLIVQELYNLKNEGSDDSNAHQDSINCSVSALLHFLCHVYINSVSCRQQVIFLMCQLIKDKIATSAQVVKALNTVVNFLGYPSIQSFVEPHFVYIFHEWLDLKYSIGDFPFSILECKNVRDFCVHYYRQMVPILVYHFDLEPINVVSSNLNKSSKDVLNDCCPQILSHIFSWYAVLPSHEQANRCAKFLVDSTSQEIVTKCLVENMDDIIISLLGMLEEELCESEEQSTDLVAMSANSPHCISPAQLLSTLEVLKTEANCKTNFISFLCKKQDSLQNILLSIQVQLSKSRSLQEEKQAILMLQVFTELLLPEFKSCLENYHTFLLTEIVHCLITCLATKDYAKCSDCVPLLCINLMHRLLDEVLPFCKEVVGNLLPFIVSRLLPLVCSTNFGRRVLSLLTYLIIQNTHYLEEYITRLNPFPEVETFQKLREKHEELLYRNKYWDLEKEINHFCQSYKANGRTTIEGLKHLCSQLRVKKDELQKMLENLQEERLFFEDIATSYFHELICTLVHICIQSTLSNEIRVEAGRCLGEIGPVDFSTTVLQTTAELNSFMGIPQDCSSNVFRLAYNHVLNLLAEYLKDTRIKIKVLASQVLKSVFKTQEAQKFLLHQKASLWFKYFYPFYMKGNQKDVKRSSFAFDLEKINNPSLWAPEQGKYGEWITKLVTTLLQSGVVDDAFFEQLIPICSVEPTFSSQILPYFIYSAIQKGDEQLRKVLSECISSFFLKLSNELDTTSDCNSSSPLSSIVPRSSFYSCKTSVQTMLSVISFLRLQVKSRTGCSNSWTGLTIDYLLIAQAAQYCSAYFTAILFTELWCDSLRGNMVQLDSAYIQSSSPMSLLNTQNQNRVALAYKILLDAYEGIGDPDGMHGCVNIANDCQSVILNYYVAEKKWDKLLSFYNIEKSPSGVLKALKQCELDYVLQNFIHFYKANEISAEMVEYQCECAWKMSWWEAPVPESETPGFQENFYKSLQCLYNRNDTGFKKHLEASRLAEFQQVSHTSLESVTNILPVLSRLQMLVLAEDYSDLAANPENFSDLQDKWEKHKKMPFAEFEFYEPISWLQCTLLKQQLSNHTNVTSINVGLKKCLEEHSIKAREEGHLQVATKSIEALRSSGLGSEKDILRWQIEQAKILWTKEETLVAKRILKSVISSVEKYLVLKPNEVDMVLTYAKILSLSGKWMSETLGENSAAIMKDYLEKAINVLESTEQVDDSCNKVWDAYLAVARFADKQYRDIVVYKKSIAYQTKLELMELSRASIEKSHSKGTLSDDEKKTLIIMKRQHAIDVDEMESMDNEQQQFLMKAITNYLIFLRGTDANDLWVFRLTALWFHNLGDDKVNATIKENLSSVPTYKFLPLMYQLAARMGTQTSSQFSDVLTQLIKRITLDHPHHALPVILSMSNADKDQCGGNIQSSSKKNPEDSARKERMVAARKLVSELRKTKLSGLLQDMSALCDAYISLAYMAVGSGEIKSKKRVKIPPSEPIMKLRNLSNVPVITEDIKVDRSCEYSNLIGIHSFSPDFRLCGGINVPKVIKCVGLDGKVREQLVKGRDDLRQDAVMQQVFSLVNCLLKQNKETSRRKLRVRTYKIVPLSRRSGVLQWCEGTRVLSNYLVSVPPGGAHQKYYPLFWSHRQCVIAMKSITNFSSLKKKREVFDDICKNFPPVFRYFFLENFPQPSAWLERRLSYTKSVATSSIVGYILGLGDRHVNNILIDNHTAEIIHIDFGIAFEKGKIMTTPETVPFRLTRDIVDGMGFIGIEGTFKRCCEKTLGVMRESQDVLLPILEVLLYDPLYDWTIPAKGSSSLRQSASPECVSNQAVNQLAERALVRLQEKLQGLEDGMALSVSGQVNLLIQQAQDPNNLCRIYAGWQPFL